MYLASIDIEITNDIQTFSIDVSFGRNNFVLSIIFSPQQTSKVILGEYSFQAAVYDPSTQNFLHDSYSIIFLPKAYNVIIQTVRSCTRPMI